MKLKDRIAIVTGASGGIGRAYALALAAEGATVIAAARRLGGAANEPSDANSLSTLVRESADLPGHMHAHVCDMESEAAVVNLVQQTGINFGRIDVLINNAAILGKLNTFEITGEMFDRYMVTNVRGPFIAIREVAMFMKRQHSGSVINITAAVGNLTPQTNFPEFLAYGVSKAGLNRLSYYMASELKPFNVAVNALSPGVVASESALKANPDATASPRFKACTPQALGPALVYLASRTAEDLTGQWLHTDEFGKSWGVA
jgi:NAD(P)-dependent dehydrogenase (short-subunit alcohol dehydrogenase family)